jgi:hypothetical protein
MRQLSMHKSLFIRSLFLIGVAVLIFIFGLFPNLVLNIYSNGIYPIISTILRWVSSLLPFALGDILYGLLIIFALFKLFKFLKKIKEKRLKKEDRWVVPLHLFHIILIFYISFKLLWGLNYSRPSLSKQLNINDEKYTVKELVSLGNFFIHRLNSLQDKIDPKLTYTITQLQQQSVAEYLKMGQKNNVFKYIQPSFKPVFNNWMVSKIGIEGYYNPFSGEANVNMALPAWVLPFVSCHEISHQLGVAREDEANLIAYLVGINSNDINFQYSVNYNMLRYILFEIRFKSPEDYLKMRDQLHPGVLANFKSENEFWRKYNGNMSNYMGVAFDKFLKLNNQKRGIKSYQNIVIWLWNYHKKEISG